MMRAKDMAADLARIDNAARNLRSQIQQADEELIDPSEINWDAIHQIRNYINRVEQMSWSARQ